MRVVQISRPDGPFEMVERDIPEPGAGSVRIKVQACGVCHSDTLSVHGGFPGLQYPIVPGHEVVGVVESMGLRITRVRSDDGAIWYLRNGEILRVGNRSQGRYVPLHESEDGTTDQGSAHADDKKTDQKAGE